MKGIIAILAFIVTGIVSRGQKVFYVSTDGNDTNKGSVSSPYRSVGAAVENALKNTGIDVTIYIRGGTYYPERAIIINSSRYTLRSLTISGYRNEKVTISGAAQIMPEWKPYGKGIMQAKVSLNNAPDRLWMNEKNLPMARFPDFDSAARVFNGTSAEALSKQKVREWKNPSGGYVHALHQGEWGGFHYLINGKNDEGELSLEGGWQNNRPAPLHSLYRFVENIFEELDAPGEWYYDKDRMTLYVKPPAGEQLANAKFYVSRLNELIVIKGSAGQPVKNITVSHLNFTGTSRTFMNTKEPLLRSDWTIYRGGAVLLDGTENITISNCTFNDLGGNAIFLSNYNNKNTISSNHIHNIGASAILFVGNPDAVRSPSFRYEQYVPWNEMDFEIGPRSNDYPQHCTAKENLIHNIGFIEKQVAGIEIAMSSNLHIVHNTIYNVPRAGINIGDGCWGGHVLEYNDVFNTVLETGDHGAFNSWGRDRFWRPEREITDSIVEKIPGIELFDAVRPVTIRNNRFHCEHGWDIDLDDGSSNYYIVNNVCLNGGLKLREGYHRVVTNNIILNNTFHPHVWYKKSNDRFTRNIIGFPYAPIMIEHWGSTVDSNLFITGKGLVMARMNGTDSNSISGDPAFIDPVQNNFNVSNASPALSIGFKNFSMNFGVTDPSLKRIAMKAPVPQLTNESFLTSDSVIIWEGCKIKNITTLGERSAAGIHDNKGVLIVEVGEGTILSKSGIRQGDTIVKMGEEAIESVHDFIGITMKSKWMGQVKAVIIRNQKEQNIQFLLR